MPEAITETPATPTTQVEAKPSPTLDDLTAFLQEFDAGTKPQAAPAAAKEPEPVRATNTPTDTLSDFLDGYEKSGGNTEPQPEPTQPEPAKPFELPPPTAAEVHALRTQVFGFDKMVGAMYQHQLRVEAQQEFEGVVSRADKMLKDSEVAVGKDYARRWLVAESQLNPQLVAAFDNRNRSYEDQRRYQRLEKKALERMYASAKAEPDQSATADRRAVVAAVMGRGGSAAMPEAKPIRYGDLDDAQFAAEKKKLGL